MANLTNPAADNAEAVTHFLTYDVAVNAAEAAAIAAFPPLGWPVIHQLFQLIVGKLADFIYSELSKYVAFTVIDVQANQEQSAYKSATENLKNTINKQGATDAEIQAAKDEFRRRLGDLIRFDK